MKLSRQSTTESDKFQKESSPFGVRSSELLRGRKHHFLVENATAAELEAMDDLLRETEFGENCDGCPIYDEGYSCGWWIAIEDVPAFKAEYKRLKGEVAARIEENKAEAVDEALAAMTFDDVAIIARVAYNVRTDLLTEGSTVNSLRNPDYCNPVANPFHNGRNVLTADLWALVAQCLVIGKNETCNSLHLLEKKADAEIVRRRDADEPRRIAEVTRAEFWMLNPVRQREAIADAHTEALARNAIRTGAALNEVNQGTSDAQAAFFGANDYFARRGIVEAAHGEALAINAALDNSLPEFSTPALQRFWPALPVGMKMLIINAAHTKALIEDDEFDGIIRDGLTPEQRAIQTRREGTDIYGENYFDRQMDEAYAYDLMRNRAIRDEAHPLTTRHQFQHRQSKWEGYYDDYKTARIEVAHAAALEMNRDHITLKEFVRQCDDLAPAHPELVAALNGALVEDSPIYQTRKKE
ncbi:DUF5417 domain-containing protein [Leclercia adecarboxylata]|uniref:DUF5417 domain-containing protein n=1 Tax=Leclercia adecarboxylata TaxID=83655 RepID=UPI0013D4F395|nr:DUF5417 domain-containing protein [Leclercia adecarboxylata]